MARPKGIPHTEEQKRKMSEAHKLIGAPWNIGKRHSKETKRKMSLSHLGMSKPWVGLYERTLQAKENIAKSAVLGWVKRKESGWTVSQETKEKIRNGHIGKSLSKEHRKNISISHSGSKHYRWNPDREVVKLNLRNDGGYGEWRRLVKERDSNICQLKDENCVGYMIAAHIKGWALYPELRYQVNNGITLCQAHHPRTRDEDQRLMPVFQELVGSGN